MALRPSSFAVCLLVLGFAGTTVFGQGAIEGPPIDQLLARVPDGATWQDLAPDLRADLERRASVVLARDRLSWGLTGLQEKLTFLSSTPTSAMTENIDRVLSVTFASTLPGGFRMARDIESADLRHNLLRLYLGITDDRGYMLYNHPEFRGWDGMPVKELQLLDHEHLAAMASWYRQTEDGLRQIPDGKLTPLEKALRAKSYFATRAGKYFDRPAVALSGSMNYAAFYSLPVEQRPFASDAELLDAYNASMFSEFREVNMGTLDAFLFDHESEFNPTVLEQQGMSDALAKGVLRLGGLYRSRVQARPDKGRRCTIFSPAERQANWDAFTAQQISNADGSETLEAYARRFEDLAAQRRTSMQALGRLTVERLFPDGSPDLSREQRMRVIDELSRETRPAMMMATLQAALDTVTGTDAASRRVMEAVAKLPSVGGAYSPGDAVRAADKAQILEMWNRVRAFIKREYGGYRVDIAALIPAEPTIAPTGQSQSALGGQVFLSLGDPTTLASLSSTLMHEIKHAIDQNSHAAVEGSAWEGAATSVERQLWPLFIAEAMAGQEALLPVARIVTEIDNVRFAATTDATLRIFLRESCDGDAPDTIAYAEGIVRSYGYSDETVLRLRSRRAHSSWQYLEYDYGYAMYAELLKYLQDGVGPKTRVDAYLLQACGLPSPNKDEAAVESLKACIRDRKT